MLKRKSKKNDKNIISEYYSIIGKKHVANSKAGYIDLNVRMVFPEKSTLIE